METVQEWSIIRGYEYIQVSDAEFIDSVPDWYARKCTTAIQPITDLARLEIAAKLLASGADRVIWIDADVLIFAPQKFVVPSVSDCAFTREIWLDQDENETAPLLDARVNNAVSVFARQSVFLPFYRGACNTIVQADPAPISKCRVGTDFLTALHALAPFTLIRHVGNLSPHVLQALVIQDFTLLRQFADGVGEPLYAANLAASHENREYEGTRNDRRVYDHAVESLLSESRTHIFGGMTDT